MSNPWDVPPDWEWQPFDELITIERTRADLPEAKIYVGLENIEPTSGRLTPVTVEEAGVRGEAFQFDDQNILYGKLRPYLNKVATPKTSGACSTDILPLRVKPGVSRMFVTFLMRSAYFRSEAIRLTNGQLPRISPRALVQIPVPVPPLPVQNAVAAQLSEYALLAERCIDAAAQVEELPVAFLAEQMRLHEVSEGDSWPIETIADVSMAIEYGMNESASLDSGDAGSHRFVRITDIDDVGRLKPTGVVRFSHLSDTEKAKYELRDTDLLFARTGFSIGGTYLHDPGDGPCVFASYLIRARINRDLIDPHYAAAFMQSPKSKKEIWHAARGGGKPNLNKPRIAALQIPRPPKNVQEKVVSQSHIAREMARHLRQLSAELSELLVALADKAMRSEAIQPENATNVA